MEQRRKPVVITKKTDRDYILNVSGKQAESLSFMMETFGIFDGKQWFRPYDIIDIPPGYYGANGVKNKNTFRTTVGRWIFNKCFIEPELFSLFGYLNKTDDKKLLGYINDRISYALLENKIPLDALKKYLMREQKYQAYANILSPGFTDKMLLMSKTLAPYKEKLLKKYAKELEGEDTKLYAIDKIQKELLAKAREILKDDPSMDMYTSGAKGSFGNNFANIFVCKGASKDPTNGYNVITSNLIDGIKKEDYVNQAKSLTEGPYARGVKTQSGGYWEKLFLRALQHLRIGAKGSDCGTKRTITITLTKDVIPMVMYNFIVVNDTLIELTSENIDQYKNKEVHMRFASLCEHDKDGKICNACIGNFFYRAGYENVGTAIPQLASRLKNIAMKAFHDSTVKLHTIDVARAFGFKKKAG